MSYLNNVKQLFQKGKWDYYDCHYQENLHDVFSWPISFINNTFMGGHKNKLIAQNDDIPNISKARAAHSISSYFMGFILAEGLSRNFLENFCTVKGAEFGFSYVWYLTSLYHDFGYRYEYDTELAEKIYDCISKNRYVGINDYYHGVLYQLRRQISIKHSIWNVKYPCSFCTARRNLEDRPSQRIQEYVKQNYRDLSCNGYVVRMPMRSSRIIGNYLKYRLLSNNTRGRIDHGICGGMLFYDRIIKNYINKYECEKRRNPNIDLYEFFENDHGRDLRFSLKQLIVFMYVADCIINHNIWKASTNDEDTYRHYKLCSLIGNMFEKVNFHKNPLLFILVMSDTLEPYKNFYAASHHGKDIDSVDYNVDDVFSAYEKFDISFSSDEIHIRVSDDLKNACKTRLQGMEEWIDIRFAEEECGFVITVL